MSILGVAFDLEGTVVNVEFAHFEAFRLVAEKFGVHFDPDNLLEDFAGKIERAIGGGDALISEGISRLSGGSVDGPEIRRRKMVFYNEIIEGLKSIEPRPGFLKVFEQIRDLRLKVAIASLTPRRQAEVLLERSGVGKLFPPDCILLEDSIGEGRLKPSPDVYEEAARRMGIAPAEQLVFEDSSTGVKAAHAAGSPVVAIPIYTFKANKDALLRAGAREELIFESWEKVDITALLKQFEGLNA